MQQIPGEPLIDFIQQVVLDNLGHASGQNLLAGGVVENLVGRAQQQVNILQVVGVEGVDDGEMGDKELVAHALLFDQAMQFGRFTAPPGAGKEKFPRLAEELQAHP